MRGGKGEQRDCGVINSSNNHAENTSGTNLTFTLILYTHKPRFNHACLGFRHDNTLHYTTLTLRDTVQANNNTITTASGPTKDETYLELNVLAAFWSLGLMHRMYHGSHVSTSSIRSSNAFLNLKPRVVSRRGFLS